MGETSRIVSYLGPILNLSCHQHLRAHTTRPVESHFAIPRSRFRLNKWPANWKASQALASSFFPRCARSNPTRHSIMAPTLRTSRRNRDPRETHSRNPGRRDGFHWNADAFICPASVDGFRRDVRDTEAAAPYDDADLEDARVAEPGAEAHQASPRHEVALMDIARYAKLKGVAKDFEILDAPRRVIVLDEDIFVVDGPPVLDDSDSEWEDINAFEDSNSRADPSTSAQDYEADDYLLARRLQEEECAGADAGPIYQRGVAGTRRRAYADVLALSNG
ncbi:hypothetical protein B0H12DRAFT_1114004 [Mycena haematopus]|nr:hypothetical protein B0H12DRAFT_1114004 [Mycena haematopus]